MDDGSTITLDDYEKLQKQMFELKQENDILKKAMPIFAKKINDTEITDFIYQQKDHYPVNKLCKTLDVPSTYYQSLHKTISNRDRENIELTKEIIDIHNKSYQRYGAPKIFHVSLKRVQRLMKKANIRSITVKKFRPTPSIEKVVERENILQRDFSAETINKKWVGDITYIHTLRDGWCYLASIMDLHTKKIVGYSFSHTMTTDLIINAIRQCLSYTMTRKGNYFSLRSWHTIYK